MSTGPPEREPPGGGRLPDSAPLPQREPMPLSKSILWTPGEQSATATAEPDAIFIRQRALGALNDHLKAVPDKGLLGFLVGGLYVSPESETRYLVVDTAIRLPLAIFGDKVMHVVSQVWPRLQDEIGKSQGRLLGWYHSHPPVGVALAPADIETHHRYFGEAWQFALVLGTDKHGPAGGFFRPARNALQPPTRLPFYELLHPDALSPEGKYRSKMVWQGYLPHRPTAPPPRVVERAPAVVLLLPPPPAQWSSGRRVSLFAVLGVVAVGGAAAAFVLLQPRAPPRAEPDRAVAPLAASESAAVTLEPAAVAAESVATAPESARAASGLVRTGPESARAIAEPARTAAESAHAAPGPARPAAGPASVITELGQLGASLAGAIYNYMRHTTLFDTKQLDCPGLRDRLVAVEERGMAYYAEQRAQAAPLDPARAAKHRSFYWGIDSVQSHFNRSGCTRP